MIEPGTRISGFEVLDRLGVGGMGEVYRARDPRLQRDVAIKVLPDGLSGDPDRLARFQQEARAASALNHPNILHVYDAGQDGDTHFLVTELVDGSTLRDLISDGPLLARKLLEIGEQIAAGLAKAHAAGIVHRDLKPENVMVTGDGVVKILDFGLAKLLPISGDSGSHIATAVGPATGSGMVLGTAAYMSPEQAQGRPVEFPSDQFSLGTVLYEMGAGDRPFRGESFVQTLNAIIEDEPESILRANPRLPQPFGWIVGRCLAKSAADRYASTLDLARDLRSLRENLSDLTSSSAMAAAPEVLARPRPTALGRGLWIGLLLGIVAGAGLTALVTSRLSDPYEPPKQSSITFSGKDGLVDASPDGRTLTFVSLRGGRSRIWLRQIADGSEIVLTEGEDTWPQFSPDGNSVLFNREEGSRSSLYRVSALGGEPRRILTDATSAGWSPDGKSVAFVRYDAPGGQTRSLLGVATADGADERILVEIPRRAMLGPRFSPDGKWIATVGAQFGVSESGDNLLLARADGSEHRWVPAPMQGGDLSAVAWLPGSREVLYLQAESHTSVSLGSTLVATGASRMFRHDLFSGKAEVLLWTPNLSFNIDVVRDGEVVFDSITASQNLQEYDLTQGPREQPQLLSQGSSLDRQPLYSSDGKWVVYSSNRTGNLDIWARNLEDGTERRLTDHEADDWDPGFTRDGKLIFTSRRTGHFEIWMAEPDGSAARQVSQDGYNAENATQGPGEDWLVYNSGRPEKTGLWKVRRDGSEATYLVPGALQWPEASPDGRYASYSVVTRWGLSEIHVARVEDGEVLPFRIELPGFDASTGRTRWMPDGKSIAFTWKDETGQPGIFVQAFDPEGADTSSTRRPLILFSADVLAESFGISPDGTRLTAAGSLRQWSLMLASNLRGVRAVRP